MTITEILFELNSFTDGIAKKLYLEEHLKDIIPELLALDIVERDRYTEKLYETFEGTRMKGSIKKLVESALSSQARQNAKKTIEEFSDVDIDKLVHKNGMIIPTPSNYYEILLAAKQITMTYDNMAASICFDKIAWEPNAAPYTIEYYGGETKQYYKYEDNYTMLKIAMNKGPFPAEINFSGLDDVVEQVAKVRSFDAYKDWLFSHRVAFDGVDYINDPNNNFAVKYLGVAPGPWSAIWCRMLMINMLARCDKAGVHIRYYFIIEGNQNIGKSSFCAMLVPKQWFISTGLSQAQANEDNFNRSIHDKGIVELAELGGMHRVEQNLFKKIATDPNATFRKMRANPVIQYPKHHIMIVTTNDPQYLRDATGETRAMPIKSELKSGQLMDLDGFAKVYPMILAQAIQMYEAGVSRYLTDEEQVLQKDQTNDRDTFSQDDVYKIVGDYLYTNNGNTINMEVARKEGLWYKLIYDYVKAEYETMNPLSIIKYPHKIGQAFEKFGFNRVVKGGKIKTPEGWKSAQKWFWSGKDE